jgi:hypothetical protein
MFILFYILLKKGIICQLYFWTQEVNFFHLFEGKIVIDQVVGSMTVVILFYLFYFILFIYFILFYFISCYLI